MNCECLSWGYAPEMGEWANGHHPNCTMHPDKLATTTYICQRCEHEFAVRGRTATVQQCPSCGNMAEPMGMQIVDREAEEKPSNIIKKSLAAQALAVMKSVDDQARLAVLRVSYSQIVDLIRWSLQKEVPKYMVRCIGVDCEIPDKCEVIDVHHEFASRTFCIVLRHPSFAVVPEGTELPILNGKLPNFDFQSVRIAQVFDGEKTVASLEDQHELKKKIDGFDGATPLVSTKVKIGESPPPGSKG